MVDIIQGVKIEGVDKATQDLNRLGQAGERAFERLRQAGARVGNLGKNVDKAGESAKSLQRLEKASYDLGKSLRDTGGSALELGKNLSKLGAIAAGAAAVGMFSLAKSASKVTSEIREASIRFGTTGKELVRLGFAAEQSGSSTNKLQRALGLIAQGETQVEEALKKYGVELKAANGESRDSIAVLLDFADKLAEMPAGFRRTSAAAEVLGTRVGPGLVELLEKGRKGIGALGDEAEKLGLTFTEAQLTLGKDFGDALNRTSRALTAFATRIGLAFQPALIKLLDGLSEAIVAVTPYAVQLADAIGSKLTPAVKGILDFLGPFGTAFVGVAGTIAAMVISFKILGSVLGPFAGIFRAAFLPFSLLISTLGGSVKFLTSGIGLLINAVRVFGLTATAAFGPWGPLIAAATAAIVFLGATLLQDVNWAQFGQEASVVITNIITFFRNLTAFIVQSWNDATQFVQDVITSFGEIVTTVWEGIVSTITTAWTSITELFSTGVQFFTDIWTSVTNAFRSAWDKMKQIAVSAWEAIKAPIQPTIDFINRLIDRVRALASAFVAVKAAQSDTTTGGQGKAGGGQVVGPGTKTSDSILARLSRGEFVIKARAVDKYGLSLMHAINEMRFPLQQISGFAAGGFVDAVSAIRPRPVYAFADGGPAPKQKDGRTFVLDFGGQERFNMVAEDSDTADRMVRFAVTKQARAAGKRPRYFGGG